MANKNLPDPDELVDETVDPNTLIEESPSGLPKFQPEPNVNAPFPYNPLGVPTAENVLQNAPLLNMPGRGGRGIAVGLKSLAGGAEPADALNRAAAAVQPGFEPQPGEGIAAAVGQGIGDMPAAALLGPAEVGAGTAKVAFNALRQGMTSAAMRTIGDASDKGDVDIRDVLYDSVLGMAFPLFLPLSKRIVNAVKEVSKVGTSSATSISREAVEGLERNPKVVAKMIKETEGIGEKVLGIQKKLVDHFSKIGKGLRDKRIAYGIDIPLEESIDNAIQQGYPTRTSQEILSEFKDLQRGFRIVDKEVTPDIFNPRTAGQRVKQEIQQIDPKERLQKLYRLRREIDVFEGKKTNALAQIQKIPTTPDQESIDLMGARELINPIIDKEVVPKVKGSAILRLYDRAYSDARNMYDAFAQKLATKGTGEQVMERIYRKGNPNEIVGLLKDPLETLQRLEKVTKEKLIKPIMDEFSAREFRTMKSKNLGGFASVFSVPMGIFMKGILGTEGTVNALRAINGLNSGLSKTAEVATSQAARAAAAAALLNRQGDNQQ